MGRGENCGVRREQNSEQAGPKGDPQGQSGSLLSTPYSFRILRFAAPADGEVGVVLVNQSQRSHLVL